MQGAVIILLSLMAGCVTIGFVWFGWNLCENLVVWLHLMFRKKPTPAEDAGKDEPAPFKS